MIPIQSTTLLQHLDAHCQDDKRVTVFWSCGDEVFCTTGKIIDLFDDVLVIVGFVPTSRETLAGDRNGNEPGHDCDSLELATFINLESVCAVVAGVPPCREACLPECCSCREHH